MSEIIFTWQGEAKDWKNRLKSLVELVEEYEFEHYQSAMKEQNKINQIHEPERNHR